MNRASVLGSAALCLSALAWTGSAHAAPCADLPNPLVVSGSTAVFKLINAVQPLLAKAAAPDQISVVYKRSGSCSGVLALAADATPTGACTATACVMGTAEFWNTSTNAIDNCDLAAGGTHIDLILSDVYKESCEGVANPNLRDQNLLVIPFGLIAAKASTAEAIDAREGYFVYGRGMSAGITPWTNELLTYRRTGTSGTQITIYKHLRIPTGSTIGVDAKGTPEMVMAVAGASAADSSLGFASLDAVDERRNTVKILAYRHWGQSKFYWPDFTNASYDKKNVRDGHYPLWSYEHAITLVDAAGAPVKPLAKKFADILAGTVKVPDIDANKLVTTGYNIPLCAMDVARTTDGGDFTLATGESCACSFDKNVSGGSTTCKTCAADTDCTSGQKCRNTYCEAR